MPSRVVPPDFVAADITGQVIGAFYAVYNELRHGFLENVYAASLEIEFHKRELSFAREVPLAVLYHGVEVGRFRADFLVDGRVVVEVKASKAIGDADHAQLLNYLRASGVQVGLLLHFGPKANVHRLMN